MLRSVSKFCACFLGREDGRREADNRRRREPGEVLLSVEQRCVKACGASARICRPRGANRFAARRLLSRLGGRMGTTLQQVPLQIELCCWCRRLTTRPAASG